MSFVDFVKSKISRQTFSRLTVLYGVMPPGYQPRYFGNIPVNVDAYSESPFTFTSDRLPS